MKRLLMLSVLFLAGCGAVQQAAPTPKRIVFLGDSITAQWPLAVSFPSQNYINMGVPGDTAEQVAGRFHAADTVLVLAGTNDVFRGVPISQTEAAIELLHLDGHIVLCTIPPMRGLSAHLNPQIVSYNAWLKTFAAQSGVTVADYYSALVDGNGELRQEFNSDDGLGVHLNAAGYQAITPVAQSVIREN